MKKQPIQRGFVALMSVIIISAILLVTIYLLSASSFLNRFDSLDFENKRVSLGLAEACVNAAVLEYAQGVQTAQQVTVEAGKTCRICSINLATGVILTRAVYNHAYTNITATVNSTYALTNWSESQTYVGPPACPLP